MLNSIHFHLDTIEGTYQLFGHRPETLCSAALHSRSSVSEANVLQMVWPALNGDKQTLNKCMTKPGCPVVSACSGSVESLQVSVKTLDNLTDGQQAKGSVLLCVAQVGKYLHQRCLSSFHYTWAKRCFAGGPYNARTWKHKSHLCIGIWGS